MYGRRLSLIAVIGGGVSALGACLGIFMGQFTVTGGLQPMAGWQVPSYGVERELADLPPAMAVLRAPPEPQFVGYYPAQPPITDSDIPEVSYAGYDATYDDLKVELPSYREPAYADAIAAELARAPAPGPTSAPVARTMPESLVPAAMLAGAEDEAAPASTPEPAFISYRVPEADEALAGAD